MNKRRREDIEIIQHKLLALGGFWDEILSDINSVLDEEQDAYDNLPWCFQESDKGYNMQEAIDNLNYALDIDLQSYIDEIDSYLEDAKVW